MNVKKKKKYDEHSCYKALIKLTLTCALREHANVLNIDILHWKLCLFISQK